MPGEENTPCTGAQKIKDLTCRVPRGSEKSRMIIIFIEMKMSGDESYLHLQRHKAAAILHDLTSGVSERNLMS